MQELTHDFEQVSGGDASYNLGHTIGDAFRSLGRAFVDAGSLYVPIL